MQGASRKPNQGVAAWSKRHQLSIQKRLRQTSTLHKHLRLRLLDEPSMGLAPQIGEEIFKSLPACSRVTA
ncbi:MAG: hypothetical protein ABI606_00840 [Rhodoferax sp.]